MQRFIDKEIYVYCETAEDTYEFVELCQQYNLKFTERWNLLRDVEQNPIEYTFVLDWIGAEANDGVSAWQFNEDGDGDRPTVHFKDLNIDNSLYENVDIDGFLGLI